MKSIAVFTSGGDAPGMNAAVRAVVRTALHQGLNVYGVKQGYEGLMSNEIFSLKAGDVANIIQRGGTILKSGRALNFLEPSGRKKAAENLKKHNIEGLICIGGDGSLRGVQKFYEEHNIPFVGIPGTIDNDIYGTESIGFDTAVNTAVEALDRIRDTATSHDRLFIVEVMGRTSEHIAVMVALAGGAEEVFTFESLNIDDTISHIQKGISRGKKSSLLVVPESETEGRAYSVAKMLKEKAGFEGKVCILGHIQRGGSPSAWDRYLASLMGYEAVLKLLDSPNVLIGYNDQKLQSLSLSEVLSQKKEMDPLNLKILRILSS